MMYKKLYLLLFLPLVMMAQENNQVATDVAWLLDYEEAVKKASKEKKNVLVYFTGSDWCPPCIKLKKDLFDTEAFSEVSQDYVLLYVDIPQNQDLLSKKQLKHNNQLVASLNKKGVFPLMTILSSRGKQKDELSGYSMNGEIRYHLDFLKKNK